MPLALLSKDDLLVELNLAYAGAPSDEDLAHLLREAASRVARFRPAELRQRVLRPMRSVWDERGEELRERLDDLIDALVSYGDLLEVAADESLGGRYLCVAPPAFVTLASGAMVLLGGLPNRPLPLPDVLVEQVERNGHARLLRSDGAREFERIARSDGWIAIPETAWLAAPLVEPCSAYRARFNVALAEKAQGTAAGVEDLVMIRPDRPADYYRGRWGPTSGLTGRLLGRRGQRYGAAAWCYVELEAGLARRLVDLPDRAGGDPRDTAADQAWRLQAAIDAERHLAPRWSVKPDGEGWTIGVSMPPPRWAERRFAAVGRRVRRPGAVVTYLVAERADAFAAAEFYATRMWAQPTESSQ
ncbi:MAG: hypothetical protein JWM10_717 [Myxococcaceae bacterium]|nr:hypothetical protein [Myxococcaceae bacterium]